MKNLYFGICGKYRKFEKPKISYLLEKTLVLSIICHCVKFQYSELFWSAFSRIRTEYREILGISPHSVQMRENGDQNNSEYGHFLRSVH